MRQPVTGAGFRFVLAGLAMYAIAALQGKLVPPRDLPWKLVLILAAFLFGLNYVPTYTAETHSGVRVEFGRYLIGERTTPVTWLWLLQRIAVWIVGFSSLIISVIAVLIGVLAGGEVFGAREFAAVALVIAGVWLALQFSSAG